MNNDKPLTEEQSNMIKTLKAKELDVLSFMETAIAPSRERALAATNLEQAFMWARKAYLS